MYIGGALGAVLVIALVFFLVRKSQNMTYPLRRPFHR